MSEYIEQLGPLLYPETLTVTGFYGKNITSAKANGGWGDYRDHQMCININKFNSTSIQKVLGYHFSSNVHSMQ